MPITVGIASKNPNKIRAVERAFLICGFKAVIIPVEPPPDLPKEPIGLDQIHDGAVKRALHALKAVNADFGVGIEAGVVRINDDIIDITIAAIADQEGKTTIGVGPGFMIPPKFKDELLKGRELAELVEAEFGIIGVGRRSGFIGVLTRGLIERFDLNFQAVYMALIPRLPWNRGLYGV